MTTPAYPRPVVRHIGDYAFRDRETVEPVAKEPAVPESPALRRFREAATAGQGVSTRAARSRSGLS